MSEVLENLNLPSGGGNLVLPSGELIHVAISDPTPIAFEPGKPGFIQARQNAYDKADLSSRSRLVELMGLHLATERGREFGVKEVLNGEDQNLQQISVALAAHTPSETIDQTLHDLGASKESQASSADQRALLADAYHNSFVSKASAQLSGIATLAVTEGPINDQQMMVVATISSPALRQLASLALDDTYAARPLPEGSVRRQLNVFLDNDLQLARQFGAQMISDGKGNQFIVGYGHAEVRHERMQAIARQSAIAHARKAIMSQVEEQISTDFQQRLSETINVRSVVGEDNGNVEKDLAEQHIEALAKQRAKAQVDLPGLETITATMVTVDGRQSMIAVCIWSPAMRDSAKALVEQATKVGNNIGKSNTTSSQAESDDDAAKPGGNSTTSDF